MSISQFTQELEIEINEAMVEALVPMASDILEVLKRQSVPLYRFYQALLTAACREKALDDRAAIILEDAINKVETHEYFKNHPDHPRHPDRTQSEEE